MTAGIVWHRAIKPHDTAPAWGLERCLREQADPWPPTLPEFRQLYQPTPVELSLRLPT